MAKISVLTMHYVKNYGSVLQSYATQKLFEKHGHAVEFIDYRRADYLDDNLLNMCLGTSKGFIRFAKKILRAPSLNKQIDVFNGFVSSRINVGSTLYLDNDELISNTPKADIYCVGSDQVWNSAWNSGFLPAYFLQFAPEGSKKVSFSSSIGKSHLDDWEKPLFSKYLSDFDYVSVREQSALEELSSLGIESQLVLDPTLAVTSDVWESLCSDKFKGQDYVLIYQLNKNKDFDEFAVKFAKYHNLKLVRICLWQEQTMLPGASVLLPKVEDFVSLFANAAYVITDSFHGTAFSVNFSTEFICVYPNKFNSRLENILTLTGTTCRRLEDYSDIRIADGCLDFEVIQQELEHHRDVTNNFITDALE